MSTEYQDKLRSLGFTSRAKQQSMTKTTVDDHDSHKVAVTEHWHDRQDVNVVMDRPLDHVTREERIAYERGEING